MNVCGRDYWDETQSKVGDRTLGALWSLSSLNNKHNKDQETHT